MHKQYLDNSMLLPSERKCRKPSTTTIPSAILFRAAMLEALIAVGLAGNVVQFVQFASKLVLEAEGIRKNGNPSSLPALRKLTEDLMVQATVIINSLKSSNATLVPEDQVNPSYRRRNLNISLLT